MAVSLIKTSANPGSSYTPNALLYGWFELTVDSSFTINAPTMAADGQLIAVQLNWEDESSSVTWDNAYKAGAAGLQHGPCGNGTKWLQVFFCNGGSANCIFSGEVT